MDSTHRLGVGCFVVFISILHKIVYIPYLLHSIEYLIWMIFRTNITFAIIIETMLLGNHSDDDDDDDDYRRMIIQFACHPTFVCFIKYLPRNVVFQSHLYPDSPLLVLRSIYEWMATLPVEPSKH